MSDSPKEKDLNILNIDDEGIIAGQNPDISLEVYPKTTAEMKDETTFITEGWDFGETWEIDSEKNDGYPYLTKVPLVEKDYVFLPTGLVVELDKPERGTHVERKCGLGGKWEVIEVVPTKPRFYKDESKLVNGNTYYYRFRDYELDVFSDYYDEYKVHYKKIFPKFPNIAPIIGNIKMLTRNIFVKINDTWNTVIGVFNNINNKWFPIRDFKVEDFGIIGDGITDCTNAINDLINTAFLQGGGTVSFPEGVFIIDPDISLNLKDNVKLKLSEGTTLKSKQGTKENYSVINMIEVNNIGIEGGKIIGDRNLQSTIDSGNGITIKGSGSIEITNIEISDCRGTAISIDGNEEAVCSFEIKLQDVIIDNSYISGIEVIGARDLTIEDCIIKNTNGSGRKTGILFKPDTLFNPISGVVITDLITENNSYGVYFDFSEEYLRGIHEKINIIIDGLNSGDSISGVSSYTHLIDSENFISVRTHIELDDTEIIIIDNIDDWSTVGDKCIIEDELGNILEIESNWQEPKINQISNDNFKAGERIYLRVFVRNLSDNCDEFGLRVINGNSNYLIGCVFTPKYGEWYNLSNIITLFDTDKIELEIYSRSLDVIRLRKLQIKNLILAIVTEMEMGIEDCEEIFIEAIFDQS